MGRTPPDQWSHAVTRRYRLSASEKPSKASLVKRSETLPLIKLTEDRKGLIVNAKAFHAKLERVISEYASVLQNPQSKQARAAFRKKMDSICKV